MLDSLIHTLTLLIQNLYISTGLVGILIAMAIESCCIPLPSEIVMPLAGLLIANGKLLAGVNPWVSLVLVALAGALGCLTGSIAAYGIGYSGGRPLMLKYGRYVLISQHDADVADRFFQRWGSATAFFSRLLPIVRTYISLPAGISKMPFLKFGIYTFLGSFPWCLLLAYLGKTIGDAGARLDSLSTYFHGFDVVIIVALVILIALYIWRHIRNDRKARAEHALAEATQAATAAQAAQAAPMTNPWNQQPRGQFKVPAQQSQWGQPQSPQQQPQQLQTPPQSPWGQSQSPQPQQQQQAPQMPQQSPWSQAQPQPQWGQPQPQSWPPQADNDSIRRRQ